MTLTTISNKKVGRNCKKLLDKFVVVGYNLTIIGKFSKKKEIQLWINKLMY